MSAEYVIRDWQLCVDNDCKSFLGNLRENKHFLKWILSSEIQLYQFIDASRRSSKRKDF